MSCVRPGVLLTRASLRTPAIRFNAVDLPEFERPTNATSRPSSGGKSAGAAALLMKIGVGTSRTRASRSEAAVSVQSAAGFRGKSIGIVQRERASDESENSLPTVRRRTFDDG